MSCSEIRSDLRDQNLEPRQTPQVHSVARGRCTTQTLQPHSSVDTRAAFESPSWAVIHAEAASLRTCSFHVQNPVCRRKVCGRTLWSNTSDDCCGLLLPLHALTPPPLLSPSGSRCPNEFTGDRCQNYVMASFYSTSVSSSDRLFSDC